MNKRIETIAKYIEAGDKTADIGCDHAYLGILLASRNIYSIASDLRNNIIEASRNNIEDKELLNYIDFRVGDGLSSIKESDNINTIVLAGMGAYTIIKILNNSVLKFKKIITLSHNNNDILREQLLKLGYVSIKEEVIYDKNKYYNLIVFKEGKGTYSKQELYFGINHQDKKLFNNYLIYVYNKLSKLPVIEGKNKEKLSIIERMLENHL